jgi:tetratricopeptide (TPR) repeat protein
VENKMRRLVCLLLLIMLPLCVFARQKKGKRTPPPAPATRPAAMPLTTRSAAAAVDFEQGMAAYENLNTPQSIDLFRQAVKKDPEFAQAWLMISRSSFDPAEIATSREKAKALAPKASPDEQLFIRWMAGSQENDLVGAIAAMNDLLSKYPKDKRLLFFSAVWFFNQGAVEPSLQMSERALACDPNYAPALNEAGYAYAQLGQMDKAFATMERYIAQLPKEANPQDSYAEMLRMDGKFDQALEHYRAALNIDAKFYGSQLGIADTYTLMREFEKARQAYLVAADEAPDAAVRLQYLGQSAQTWVREGKFDEADKHYTEVIANTHDAGLRALESALLSDMALYQKDDAKAFELLDRAEEQVNDESVPASDREDRLASILRDRVVRGAECGNGKVEQAALAQLKAMAENSRKANVQQAYHLAMGASLVAAKKNGEAIEHLYENASNPRALQLLATAFGNMKAGSEAASVRQKLSRLNEPTMEQAVARAALGEMAPLKTN